MNPKTLALLFASSLFTNAAPTATNDLVARACTTVTPSWVDILDKAYPNQGNTGSKFALTRTGGPGTNTRKTAFIFQNIPAGSTGCMLQIEWPAGSDFGDGSNTANLFTTEDFHTWTPTWNHQPKTIAQVASTNLPTDKNSDAFKTILYADSCKPNMGFLLELAEWQQQAGDFSFTQKGWGYDTKIGFSMIYNC